MTFAGAGEREMKEEGRRGPPLKGNARSFIPASPSRFHSCVVQMNPSLSISFLVPTAKKTPKTVFVSMFNSLRA